MPHFELVEAKAWHCGAMSRMLRLEHKMAVAMIGLDSHRELRTAFDDSMYRKSWLIDGKLASIGGVVGPTISTYGLIWLAFSSAATKYPLAMVRLMRAQLTEIMRTRHLLITTILDGDHASERFAIFLGFVPVVDGEYIMPASSRFGRKEIARQLREIEEARIPLGTGYAKAMVYRQIEAD
jgi:hypothetical protein